MRRFLSPVRRLVRSLGFDVVRYQPVPPDFTAAEIADYEAVRAYTNAGIERVAAVCRAAEYVSRQEVPGDIVECGAWKGGMVMAVARTLVRLGNRGRRLVLFDTFAGMTAPGLEDGAAAARMWELSRAQGLPLCHVSRDEVRTNLQATGYPADRIVFVRGRVENTLPDHAPARVSLLHLATTWYGLDTLGARPSLSAPRGAGCDPRPRLR